jgi:hypothetical protein
MPKRNRADAGLRGALTEAYLSYAAGSRDERNAEMRDFSTAFG